MSRKRPSRICRRWFRPHPRVGDRQRVCSEPGCQQERHRRACAQWRTRNPDYDHVCEQGQQTPVMVIRGEAQPFVLIDGYARVQALRTLARDLVEAAVLELPEVEALVVGVGLGNARQRSALEEGWSLRELVEGHGLGLEALARKLDRSRSWVSRRLALVRALPESVQEAIRRGRLSVQAATKYMVPLARANSSQCEQLVEALDGARVSVRQMEREQALRASAPALGAMVDALRTRHGGQALRSVRRLHRLWRDYPTEPVVDAVKVALEHRLLDLSRIERMVLRRIAGDFFRLPIDDDPTEPGG